MLVSCDAVVKLSCHIVVVVVVVVVSVVVVVVVVVSVVVVVVVVVTICAALEAQLVFGAERLGGTPPIIQLRIDPAAGDPAHFSVRRVPVGCRSLAARAHVSGRRHTFRGNCCRLNKIHPILLNSGDVNQ